MIETPSPSNNIPRQTFDNLRQTCVPLSTRTLIRELDTINQMAFLTKGMLDKVRKRPYSVYVQRIFRYPSCHPEQRVSKEPMPEKKLFLIPCCASKKHNGHSRSAAPDPLSRLVSEATYSAILEARREVLSGVRRDERYLSGKYEKNRCLER